MMREMHHSILKETIASWQRHDISRHAAVVSFFMLLSVAPIVIIMSSIAGLFIDPSVVERETFDKLSFAVGQEGALLVFSMLTAIKLSPHSLGATVIGVIVLLFAATQVLTQIRTSLDRIFGVELNPGNGLRHFVLRKTVALTLISAFGLLFAVSSVLTTATTSLLGTVSGYVPTFSLLLPLLDTVASFILMTMLFALLLKYLPDVKIGWTEVIIGSLVTGILFSLGKAVIALYLRHTDVASAYGAAGSVVAVMLWVYFSAQIFFFGAEFTRAFANALGDKIKPKNHAHTIREELRLFDRFMIWLRSFIRK